MAEMNKDNFVRILSALDKVAERIAEALPSHLASSKTQKKSVAGRLRQSVLSAITANPSLSGCTPSSVVDCALKAAQLGLTFDAALGHAYMVPKKGNAEFQIGYRGCIELARRSKEIRTIVSEIVYTEDKFKVVGGTKRDLIHEPNYEVADRGPKKGVYAIVVFRDGGTDFEYMTMQDVQRIKGMSKGGDSGPWKTHEDEMIRKCPIKRMVKRLPMRPEDQELLRQLVTEEYADAGFDVGGDHSTRSNTSTSTLRDAVAAAKRANSTTVVSDDNDSATDASSADGAAADFFEQ